MKHLKSLTFILLLAFLFTACAPQPAPPTATPPPTIAPPPTETPIPEPTPTPAPAFTLGPVTYNSYGWYTFQPISELSLLADGRVYQDNEDGYFLFRIAEFTRTYQNTEVLRNSLNDLSRTITNLEAGEPYPFTVDGFSGLGVDFTGESDGGHISGQLIVVVLNEQFGFIAFGSRKVHQEGDTWDEWWRPAFEAVLETVVFGEDVAVLNPPTPEANTHYVADCGLSQVYQGDLVYVSDRVEQLQIHAGPDLNAPGSIVGLILEGQGAMIIDGPECSGSWIVWEVVTEAGIQGWLPESDGQTYWIEPFPTRPVCSTTIESTLETGMQAIVGLYPPLSNIIREESSTEANILGQVEPGQGVEITGGPWCGEGYIWWQVRALDSDLEGWTVEGDDTERWLWPVH